MPANGNNNRRPAPRRNTSSRKRGSAQKASPYLCVAAVLILSAVVLLVAIIVIAYTEEPETPPDAGSESASFAGASSAPSEGSAPTDEPSRSDEPVPPDESSPGAPSDEPSDESSLPPSVVLPSESSDDSSDASSSDDGNAGQPATAVAYEQKIGKPYAIDMTPYEQYVAPEDPMEYVFLVNPSHTLSADFEPADLVWIKDIRPGRPSYYSYMRACAEKALEAFLEEGRQYGINDVTVTNGFRSYEEQDRIFKLYCSQEQERHPDYSEEQVIAEVLTYSTRPGTSEHQSGLCVDMHNRPDTNISFAGTEAALWLEANCYRFGFILRYPANKQDITTITFEPWHFRFVGREAATDMYELGMCLEEYCAYKGID